MQMSTVNLIEQTDALSLSLYTEIMKSRGKNTYIIYSEMLLLFVIRMSTQTHARTHSHIWSTDHAYRIIGELLFKKKNVSTKFGWMI